MEDKDKVTKNELIEMIVSGGLLQDFLEFLKKKNVPLDNIRSIYDVDPELVREYAMLRSMLKNPDSASEMLDSEEKVEEKYEPRSVKPKTPPRRR